MGAPPASVIWITGAGGLIGHHLLRAAQQAFPCDRIIGLTRTELDLTDTASVRARFEREKPTRIFHCAAMSKSPACQANPKLAWSSNVDATRLLCELAGDRPFVFFSTDLVFDGRQGNYRETDAVNPLSVYAETKVAAEKAVLQQPRGIVLRTSLNAGISPTRDRAFNEEMHRAWRRGEVLQLFTDEFRCPIPASVTAQVALDLGAQDLGGIYHVAGTERISRWEIGRLIASVYGISEAQLSATSLRNFTAVPRAPDTSLCSEKVQQMLSKPLPGFSAWLAECGAAELAAAAAQPPG